MDTPPSDSDIVAGTGISQSYANMIRAGKRSPPRPLAIRIFRTTGWKHDIIAMLSDADIEVLERIDPWRETAPQGQAA